MEEPHKHLHESAIEIQGIMDKNNFSANGVLKAKGIYLNKTQTRLNEIVITSYSIHYTKLYDDKMDDGIIYPITIEENNYKKSKLTASYLTLPLMLEFQFPVNDNTNTMFLSAGMVGALNLGSHTKVKNDHSKDKDHGSFNINPFKYSAIARIGLRDISFYATYSFSSLFKEDKGPELFPFTIGISLVNF